MPVSNVLAGARPRVDNAMQRVLFAGEDSKTANLDALAQAKDMQKAGKSPDEIWDATGWFQRSGGSWNYRLDDSNFKMLKPPGKGRFLDYFSHPEAEAAYPERMRALQLNTTPATEGAAGQYDPIWKNYPGYISIGPLSKDHEQTGLHELQHAVDDFQGKHPRSLPALYDAEARAYAAEQELATRRAYPDTSNDELPPPWEIIEDWRKKLAPFGKGKTVGPK